VQANRVKLFSYWHQFIFGLARYITSHMPFFSFVNPFFFVAFLFHTVFESIVETRQLSYAYAYAYAYHTHTIRIRIRILVLVLVLMLAREFS
jgi:hypothetical protein